MLPVQRLSRLGLAALVAAAIGVAPVESFAQPPPAPATAAAAATPDRAAELFRQGNEAYKKKKWDDAYTAFKEAFALKQSYDIAGNLGDVELILNKHRDAAEHLTWSLRNWPAGQKEARARTAERLVEAKKSVAQLTIKVSVEGAEISVNGNVVGKSPLADPVFVEPGAIAIEAKSGDKSAQRTVPLDKGEEREVSLELAAAASDAGAAAPASTAATSANTANADPAGEPATGDRKPTEHGPNKTLIYAGAGLAVVGLAAGIGFTLASASKASSRDDKLSSLPGSNPCAGGSPYAAQCAEVDDLDSSAKRYRTFGIGGFVLAGVAGGATLAYAFWPRPGGTAVRISPSWTPRSAGMSVSGAF